MLGAVSYAIAGTDILRVITGSDLQALSQEDGEAGGEASDALAAKRLSARMLPFLLGGLRAPLPEASGDKAPSVSTRAD